MSDQNYSTPASTDNVYAPPEARVDDVVPEGEIELADRGTRLGAAIIDGIMLVALNFGIAMMMGINMFSMTEQPSIAQQTMLAVIGLVVFLAVNGYLLAKNGQTIGKKLLSIKIVRTDGSKITLGRIIGLRWLPMMIVGFIPIFGAIISLVNVLLIFRESRKCLHDNIADSIVIKA